LIPETDTNSLENSILEALKQGDKNRGQLLDLTGRNYPVLVEALQHLKGKELIEIYFVPSEKVSVLTYRLRANN
jgi:hypothetical protein